MSLDEIRKAIETISPPRGSIRSTPELKKITGKCSIAFLLEEIKADLGITISQNEFAALKAVNYDLCGSFPSHIHLYQHLEALSPYPEDVYRVASDTEVPIADSVNLQLLPLVDPPSLSNTSDPLVYLQDVGRYFLSVLLLREPEYIKYFHNCCVYHAKYLKLSAQSIKRVSDINRHQRRSGSLQDENRANVIREEAYRKIETLYYRNIKQMAAVIMLEMLRRVSVDVSEVLYREQMRHQELFKGVTYTWANERELACLFQPLLFHTGPVFLHTREGDGPIPETKAVEINTIRRTLGLPMLVIDLVGDRQCLPSGTDDIRQLAAKSDKQQPTFFDHLGKWVGLKINAFERPKSGDHLYASPVGKVTQGAYGISRPIIQPRRDSSSSEEEDPTPRSFPKSSIKTTPQPPTESIPINEDYFHNLNSVLRVL
ncbi:transactivating tegument protein VP16 [Testudinid alphaherpesvirus 3]|uniref:Alpha trans-inducing protein n=1 Tax=Testudinid alphaherpesvirus 3 TaxID=2560801 RepID=A0A0K1R1D6_9ALPH|nr:transactivating tegument protein VP16 [Testudinid alphaherpesvirus 3]AIU39253.1 transactivating tegument protein VP16 [Testudinid alphaherpesvirus 3]AIU39363.1 transactivating tegument protein VP16 [Testudinid alphaherpesvirus 3]AKI81639.1 transactivating tegument protein VP16 [Testudinid alphaherpesvirus 3]AKI81743.1 transactivating tegument protein VP16 [Testudinid alphaherpesvirus 3]AKV40724.1 tegument protein [Testudinid alphaherpesvirus 3]